MTELWRPVVGFKGFIEVSDQGRVRSRDRLIRVSAGSGGYPYFRMHKGKILKQARHPRGYLYITFAADGQVLRNAKVHHLVLETFVGPRPDGMECCHANDIPDDNRLENLRWDTRQANVEDKRARDGFKRTHCKRGHEFTPENTRYLVNPVGARRCKTCQRARNKGGR